jgi:hypothetical protein
MECAAGRVLSGRAKAKRRARRLRSRRMDNLYMYFVLLGRFQASPNTGPARPDTYALTCNSGGLVKPAAMLVATKIRIRRVVRAGAMASKARGRLDPGLTRNYSSSRTTTTAPPLSAPLSLVLYSPIEALKMPHHRTAELAPELWSLIFRHVAEDPACPYPNLSALVILMQVCRKWQVCASTSSTLPNAPFCW